MLISIPDKYLKSCPRRGNKEMLKGILCGIALNANKIFAAANIKFPKTAFFALSMAIVDNKTTDMAVAEMTLKRCKSHKLKSRDNVEWHHHKYN